MKRGIRCVFHGRSWERWVFFWHLTLFGCGKLEKEQKLRNSRDVWKSAHVHMSGAPGCSCSANSCSTADPFLLNEVACYSARGKRRTPSSVNEVMIDLSCVWISSHYCHSSCRCPEHSEVYSDPVLGPALGWLFRANGWNFFSFEGKYWKPFKSMSVIIMSIRTSVPWGSKCWLKWTSVTCAGSKLYSSWRLEGNTWWYYA